MDFQNSEVLNNHLSESLSLLFLQILSNDLLFLGDSSYVQELLSFSEHVLQNLVEIIEQEPSGVTDALNLLLQYVYFIFFYAC